MTLQQRRHWTRVVCQVVAAVCVGFMIYLWQDGNIASWQTNFGTVGLVLLLVAAIIVHYTAQYRQDKERDFEVAAIRESLADLQRAVATVNDGSKRQDAEAALRESRAESIALQRMSRGGLESLAGLLRERAANCRITTTRAQVKKDTGDDSWQREILDGASGESETRRRLLDKALDLVNKLFENDLRKAETTQHSGDFFKSAFFEVAIRDGLPAPAPPAGWGKAVPKGYDGRQILRRVSYCYPEGMVPREESRVLDPAREDHQRAAAIRAWVNRKIVAIPDVKAEAQSEDGSWVDLYAKQRDAYDSMLCVPAIISAPDGTWLRVYGVWVIDTNRREYFSPVRSSVAQYGSLLHPFCMLIANLYELEDGCRLLVDGPLLPVDMPVD